MSEGIKKNTGIKRIYNLVMLQIGHQIRDIKNKNKKSLFLKIFLFSLLSIGICVGLVFLINSIKDSFGFTIDENLFITIIFLTQIIGIISNIDNITGVLYGSRENTILLSLPVENKEIFISKIVVFCIDEVRKSLFFLLPFLVSYGISASAPYTYWILLVPTWLFLCLFPILFTSTFSIVYSKIKRFLQNHLWIYAIVIILFFALLYVGAFILKDVFKEALRNLNENGSATFRLIAMYTVIMNWIRDTFVITLNKFALFYNFIGLSMFNENTILFTLINLVIFIGFGLLCYFVAMPFYFKELSSSNENSNKKIHKDFKTKKRSLFGTFFKKEVLLLLRTPQKLKESLNVIFIFPLITFIMNFIVSCININNMGNYMVIAFNILITSSLLSTHNANTAQALSSEGSEFQVLKASPSNTMIISWAKCLVYSIINLLAIIVTCIVLLFTTKLSIIDLALTILSILLVSLGQIFWGFEFDVRNPKINDYATKGDSVVDNENVTKALIMGFVVSTIFGFLALILLLDDYASGWVRLLLILVAFLIARIYLYNRNLKVFFNDIQI